jgi:hypothetical protein
MTMVKEGKIAYDRDLFPSAVRNEVLPLFRDPVEQDGRISEVTFLCVAEDTMVRVTATLAKGGTRTGEFKPEDLLVEKKTTAKEVLDQIAG